MKASWLLCALVVFRCLDSLLVRTFFSPDEYWQGPEVAHRLVFGQGILTWEWLEGARIRSYLHPLLFTCLYRTLKVLGLDTRDAVAYGPSLLQALLAAVCDTYTVLLARRVFQVKQGDSSGGAVSFSSSPPILVWALFVQTTNWFNWYCSVRTFSGSLEVMLFTMGLYHWMGPPLLTIGWGAAAHRHGEDHDDKGGKTSLPPRAVSWEERVALAAGTLGIVVRPTGVFLWVVPGLWRLQRTRQPLRYMLVEVLPVVGSVLAACIALDSWCYGALVFPAWNFLRFNLLEGKSSLYGTHSFHWYFTQGLPTILTTQLPFFLLGLYKALASSTTASNNDDDDDARGSRSAAALRVLACTCIAYSAGLSLSAHKEFRFLQPLMPLTTLLTASGILHALPWLTSTNTTPDQRDADSKPPALTIRYYFATPHVYVVSFLLLTQFPMAWYLSRYHQRGPIDVLAFLSTHMAAITPPSPLAIHFLTPCHATPSITHLHHRSPFPPPTLLHLDCSPHARASHTSQSDAFLADPLAFTDRLYGHTMLPLPDYIILFGSAAKVLEGRLSDWGFTRIASFFYSSFKGDPDSSDLESSMLLFHKAPT